MKKRTIRIIIACLVLAVVGTGVFFTVKHFTKTKATTAAVSYMSTSVRRMDLKQTVDGTGTAYSSNTKTVSANNAGTIDSLSVAVGDKVKKGEVIAKVSNSSLEDTLDKADDDLKTEKLKLSQLQIELTEAKAAKTTANTNSNTVTPTVSSSTGSGNANTGRVSSNRTGQSSANTSSNNASNNNSTNNSSSVASIENQIDQQEIAISQAENAVNAAQDAIDNMTIKAPISGTITTVSVSKGDSVQNAAALVTIADMKSIRVKTAVDELDIDKVKKGQSAEITFDAIEGKTFKGTVKEIAQNGTASNSVTTYDVVVSVDNPEKVKLDMNATVTLSVKSKANALVVPADAVIETGNSKFVRVANTNSSSNSNSNSSSFSGNNNRERQNPFTSSSGSMVEVKTGMETENYIEITSGLSEGQQVLVALPKTSSSTTQQGMGGFSRFGGMTGGGFGGGMSGRSGGGFGGFNRNSSGSNSNSRSNSNSNSK